MLSTKVSTGEFLLFIQLINDIVYGMGVDLGTVLSLMGTVWTGNPLSLDPSFSIGGPSDKVFNIAENLLGLGLLGKYEIPGKQAQCSSE